MSGQAEETDTLEMGDDALDPPGRQHVLLYHRYRWPAVDLRSRAFDLGFPVPPVTLFDVPLDSEVFAPGRGPWERVLLRREPTE